MGRHILGTQGLQKPTKRRMELGKLLMAFVLLLVFFFTAATNSAVSSVVTAGVPSINPLNFGSIGTGKYVAITKSDIEDNPNWIGTYEEGDSWDYVGIQEAIYFVENNNRPKTVFLTAGVYHINKTLEISEYLTLNGEGISVTNLRVQAEGGILVTCRIRYCQGYTISNLRLIPMNISPAYGIKVISGKNSLVSVTLDNIKIESYKGHSFEKGVVLDGIRKAHLNNINVHAEKFGLYIQNDTSESNILNSFFVATKIRTELNSVGIMLDSGPYQTEKGLAGHSEGIIIENNLIYGFKNGIVVKNTFASKILNNYIDRVIRENDNSNGIVAYDSFRTSFVGNWIKHFEKGLKFSKFSTPKIFTYMVSGNHFDFCDYGIDQEANNLGSIITNNSVTGAKKIGFRFQTNSGMNIVSNNYIQAVLLELDFGYNSIKNIIKSNLLHNNRIRILEPDKNDYDG
jgi:nitrous oxidase accessory protein NosD